MKQSQGFITSLKTEAIGFGLVLAIWGGVSLFYPGYIIPSPLAVFSDMPTYLPVDLTQHALVTLGRVTVGFSLALVLGMLAGLGAYALKWTETMGSLMLALQVLPGTVLGVIFLLMFGLGNATPIFLITFLVMPTIAINTLNGLAKRNLSLEQYLKSIGSNPVVIWQTITLPALIPATQSNLSLGMGLAAKIVVLGEFIGAQDGLGYLLNRAQITFNMKEVFFYLVILLSFTLVFQAVQSFLFSLFFKKYFYPE